MFAETLIMLLFILVAVMGPSVAIAILGHAVIKALGRNPSAASKIFWSMIALLVFVEAIAVMAILVTFQLFQN